MGVSGCTHIPFLSGIILNLVWIIDALCDAAPFPVFLPVRVIHGDAEYTFKG